MPPRLDFTLAMPQPENHLFEVTLDARDLPGEDWVFTLPTWAPGSYKVRDFAKHVQDFEVTTRGGAPVPFTRVDKQSWRVSAKDAARGVRVKYRVYANELGVRSSHLDATHGYLNGTNVFVYVPDARHVPITLKVKPPRGWVVDTGLPEVAGKRNTFRADDYDHLADSPLEIGTHRRLDFDVDGVPHRIALWGRGNEDEDVLVRDVERIVREESAMMGTGLPYDEYLFILHLADQPGGGLEHRNSNTSMVQRFAFKPPKDYENVLSLEAHEFFHVWNVKRIRPAAHDPFDYSQEVYSSLLWVMEGFTGYYDHLVLARAGLMSEDRYREYLGETITKLRKQPGRERMALAESSFLAWIGLYQADENWINKGVSYYLKGELVAWALDLAIRERSKDKLSLDDLMRELYARHGPGQPGIPESAEYPGADGVRAVLEDLTGSSWSAWWRKHVTGTDEVNFERVARLVGWKLKAVGPEDVTEDAAKKGEYDTAPAWFGVNLTRRSGRVRVKHVLDGSPAEAAGLSPGDEIVALDGWRVKNAEFLKDRLREYAPGDAAALTFFRRDELVTADVTFAEPVVDKWTLEEDPKAGAAAKRRRKRWLAAYAKKRAEARVAGSDKPHASARARIEDKGE